MILELIGYLASILVATSLLMRSILRLRIINLMGAITFVIYGAFIGAYPVVAVNFVIVLINLYYLNQMFNRQEFFRLLEVSPNAQLLQEFLQFYKDDIQSIMPGFAYEQTAQHMVYFVLRDMHPAGVFIAHPQENDNLEIDLDYVIPGYRDFKTGEFIFEDNRAIFSERGIQSFSTPTRSKMHENYLTHLGFELIEDYAHRNL